MNDRATLDIESRILILAPTARDGALTAGILERAGLQGSVCTRLADVCRELDAGAAAVVLSEESVLQDRDDCLAQWLARQPAWSDLPLLVLARHGADSGTVAHAMDMLGNVTVIERPTRIAALVSSVRSAVRARSRQYQIREHLAERDRTAADLEEASRRKDEFLAILAHELRNPLAPIRNSLQILRMTGARDPAIMKVGEIMERQVTHMVRLVDDLLEVSRITRGKIELRMERVSLESVLHNAVETSRPLVDAAPHLLSVDLTEETILLEADPVRLAQVFANLINNAAKYTEPHGQIWITARRDRDHVLVSVRDNGVGIPAGMLPRIFDLFTQVKRASGLAQGGLGIGLTLVKRLVEMHEGSVWVQSDGEGKGSEFVVRLPIAVTLPAEGKARQKAPDARHPLAHRKVLIVDDNHDAADSLGALLGLLGAEVRVEYSGREAVDAVADFSPAAVFLDIGMPGMDGREVARRIRERPAPHPVALIALSGWGQADDLRASRLAGFDHHLIKPADLETLKALLGALP